MSPLASEAATIDEWLGRVLSQLSADDLLFCVLDNVCKDNTKDKVAEASKRDPRVRLVWAPENRCVVDAYFRGYREALAANCQWILEMDGGLSHLPEQIPQFIRAMEAGYDYAGGSRFCRGGHYLGGIKRRIVSFGGSVLANAVLGTRMADMTSGFECFTHEALSHVVREGVKSRAHFFQTEIRFMMHDWKWTEIPITYDNPSPSVGQSQIVEAFKNLWDLRQQARERKASKREREPYRGYHYDPAPH